MKSFFKKQQGFTLIELLVIIFITITIAVLALVNFSGARGQYKAEQAARQLVSDLRQMQNKALAGKQSLLFDAMGYGVYTQASGYILFYNKNANKSHNINSVDTQAVNFDNVVFGPVNRSIYFVPPDPIGYINSNNPAALNIMVTSNGSSKTVLVNTAGRIDIN